MRAVQTNETKGTDKALTELTKCDYVNVEDDCKSCQSKNLPCGEKLFGPIRNEAPKPSVTTGQTSKDQNVPGLQAIKFTNRNGEMHPFVPRPSAVPPQALPHVFPPEIGSGYCCVQHEAAATLHTSIPCVCCLLQAKVQQVKRATSRQHNGLGLLQRSL
jgi:hypothetical protein